MRQYIYKLIGCLFALLLTVSCSDDFLMEEPTTFVTPSNYYQTAEEAQLILNGAYDALQTPYAIQQYGVGAYWGDMGTDIELVPSWGGTSLGTYSFLPTNEQIKGMWQMLYASVQRDNIAINRIGQMDKSLFPDEKFGDETYNMKDVMLGEARFLRALNYFYLVMIYGNIPLILDETTSFGSDSYVPQATPEETYNQIIEDLKVAEESLPWLRPVEDGGKATKGAAKSLLGNVYLQMTGFPLFQTDKYETAATKLKEVIDIAENEGLYVLLDNYADIYDYTNDNNDEIIFSVQFLTGSEGGWIGSLQGQVGQLDKGGAYETTYANWDFVASFDTLDTRFAHNVTNISATTGKPTGSGIYAPWKYHKPNPNDWGINTPLDWPVLHYSEVLLKYAEALNGANTTPPEDAYWAINKVRERARPDDANREVLPDLENLTKEEFLEAILQEDAWELCWEGKRKPILIRTGRLKEYITEPRYEPQNAHGYYYTPGVNFNEDYHYWYPIPQREMDINPNLVQNPGY